MFPSQDKNPNDRDLVSRARRGDREAFTQLIVQYQVPLYNMALRMVGGREDAADISQEAFLRAWEKIRTLRDAPFKSWLFQIAVNLCYDHFRRGRRYGVMPEDTRPVTSSGWASPRRTHRSTRKPASATGWFMKASRRSSTICGWRLFSAMSTAWPTTRLPA